jgi:3',5'-cyclic AMP phosphodiesterase CpdA
LGKYYPYLGTDPEAMAYTIDRFPVRLVFLDSSIEGEIYGRLSSGSLNWLDDVLNKDRQRQTAIFLHHHPIPSGCCHMDTICCENGNDLIELLNAHPQVTRLFCGHTHRTIVQAIGGLVIMTAPSVCHQVPYDTRNPDGSYSLEPPAMLVHRFDPLTGLTTHVASLAPFDGPFPFATALGCPEQ